METGASRSPEKTGQKGRIVMENAFASMKTITLPRVGGTEQHNKIAPARARVIKRLIRHTARHSAVTYNCDRRAVFAFQLFSAVNAVSG